MITATINNNSYEVEFTDKAFQTGTINNNAFSIDKIKSNSNTWHILKDGKSYNVEILSLDKTNKQLVLKLNGKLTSVNLSDKYDALLKSLGLDNLASKKVAELKAPMPGLVLNINVNEGDTVAKGDPILVLEAMKMENIIKSPTDGEIKKINVSKGVAVEKNQLLISFQ
jgi:biotin carboxyl carrier protein